MHGIIILLQSVNILLFGHSFGQDCTEHLPAMAVEAGIENLHIGRFIKANCSLEEHWEFLETDTTAFYSESLPGERVYTRRAMSVKQVLESTAWDYVIFQNSLENEGRYSTVQPYLRRLVGYTLRTCRRAHGHTPRIGWNTFWPISVLLEDGSDQRASYRLSFYGNSSERMYREYMRTADMIQRRTRVSFSIPSGTAVMNARASSGCTPELRELTRDGYHMSMGKGRYLAACAWFEALLTPVYGISVVGNPCRPDIPGDPVDDAMALFLQRCAADAVAHPRTVSPTEP